MLKFRNLTVTPDDPVDQWGVEGLLTAIERGTHPDWARVTRAARAAGRESALRQELEEALDLAEGGGKQAILSSLRRDDETPEQRVQRRIRRAFNMADMSITDFAERVGTSRSRMSTYLSGKTMPLASVLERMEAVGHSRRAEVMFSR